MAVTNAKVTDPDADSSPGLAVHSAMGLGTWLRTEPCAPFRMLEAMKLTDAQFRQLGGHLHAGFLDIGAADVRRVDHDANE